MNIITTFARDIATQLNAMVSIDGPAETAIAIAGAADLVDNATGSNVGVSAALLTLMEVPNREHFAQFAAVLRKEVETIGDDGASLVLMVAADAAEYEAAVV